MKAKPLSAPATTERVLGLLSELDWKTARVADVGAGRGWFSLQLARYVKEQHGVDPKDHVFPCDRFPEHFEPEEVECVKAGEDGKVPFDDASMDAVVSIEVVEHVEDAFAFVRELARVVKPGGLVIVTTPNVSSLTSRVRTLLSGFPELFDPLPLAVHDVRRLGGHIHPIAPYFLAYTALRAGLVDPRLYPDRTKKGSVALAVVLAPFLLVGRALHRARLKRKRPEILEENEELLAQTGSWGMLTSRTTVLCARKPGSRGR